MSERVRPLICCIIVALIVLLTTSTAGLAADPYEIKNLASDAALTGKLEDELSKLIKAVGYTEPKDANK